MQRLVSVSMITAALACGTPGCKADAAAGEHRVDAAVGRMRVPFVANRGQIPDSTVAYEARTFAGRVVVEQAGALRYPLLDTSLRWNAIRERFSDGALQATGIHPSAAKISDLRGRDPSSWRGGLPAFEAISCGEIAEGVSLVLQARNDNVEKIFTVAAGADPKAITVRVDGVEGLGLHPNGQLELRTPAGPLRFSAPIAYQMIDGVRRGVEVGYALRSDAAYGFEVGEYDRARPLVIDPIIASTYIGRRSSDVGLAVATDSLGNVYVAGQSIDATSSSPYQTTPDSYSATALGGVDIYFGSRDAVVSKFDPTLGQLLASTFVGGSSGDGATSIAIERGIEPGERDRVVVAGLTGSADFPTTKGAFDEEHNGSSDVFVLRLDDDLSTLLVSTVVGVSHAESAFEPGTDRGPDLAIGAGGNVYAAGTTYSSDFPIIPEGKDEGYTPFQSVNHGDDDAFVIALSNDLTTLLGWTYLGGGNEDRGTAVALNDAGHVFVSGHTESAEDWAPPPYVSFPITPFAFDPTHNSRAGVVLEDGFVSRFDAVLEVLEASTFLGGGAEDRVWDIGFDRRSGRMLVTGGTGSLDFPTTPRAYMQERYAAKNGFVTALDGDLTRLAASTYLGGVGEGSLAETSLYGIAVDDFGAVWVTGYTFDAYLPTFPVTLDLADPDLPPWYDPVYYGSQDVVLTRFDRNLSELDTSLHVAGSYPQEPRAVSARTVRLGGPPDEDYVEVSITGWSEDGTPNDQFYPVFFGDPGFVNSYDYFADDDDVLVTTFRVIPEPGRLESCLAVLVGLALLVRSTRSASPLGRRAS